MSIIGKFLKIAGKDPNGNAKGVAVTENGEVKVQADELEGLLEEIRDKDFATDTKLELVRALLESINSKDYSTEVTLQAVLTELANLSDGTKAMKVQQTGSIVASDSEIYSNRIFQTIPASTKQEILPANNKYTIIDRIEFQTGYENPGDVLIHLRLKQSGGNYASYSYYFGSTRLNVMNNISTFKTIAEETNNFIVGTTREIIAPFGFKLEFENINTTEEITVRTAYTYRELM